MAPTPNSEAPRLEQDTSANREDENENAAKAPNDAKSERELQLQAITERNALESPLLRLPAELRNKIAEYVYDGTNVLIQYDYHSDMVIASSFQQKYPGVFSRMPWAATMSTTLICRQWHNETYLLPFKSATFLTEGLEGRASIRSWLGGLEKTRKNAIRDIRVSDRWGRDVESNLVRIRDDLQALGASASIKGINLMVDRSKLW